MIYYFIPMAICFAYVIRAIYHDYIDYSDNTLLIGLLFAIAPVLNIVIASAFILMHIDQLRSE
jgi:hypothetical protein